VCLKSHNSKKKIPLGVISLMYMSAWSETFHKCLVRLNCSFASGWSNPLKKGFWGCTPRTLRRSRSYATTVSRDFLVWPLSKERSSIPWILLLWSRSILICFKQLALDSSWVSKTHFTWWEVVFLGYYFSGAEAF